MFFGIPIGYWIVGMVTLIAAPVIWLLATVMFSRPDEDLRDIAEDSQWIFVYGLIDAWYLSWPIFKLFFLILLSIPVVVVSFKLVMLVLGLFKVL